METGVIIVLGLLTASSLTAIGIVTACFFLYCIRPHRRKKRQLRGQQSLIFDDDRSRVSCQRKQVRWEGSRRSDTQSCLLPSPTTRSEVSQDAILLEPTSRQSLRPTPVHGEFPTTPQETPYRQNGMLTVPSADEAAEELGEGENCFLGKLLFSVSYHKHNKELIVNICRADGLRPPYADLAPLNPYVTVLIHPDTRHKVATKVMKRTRDPKWDEVFVFEGFPFDHLMGRDLVLTVKTSAGSMGPTRQTIGELRFPLSYLHRIQRDSYTLSLSKYLQQSPLPPLPSAEAQPASPTDDTETSYRGEIEVALCYIPNVARLRVGIVRARNLGHSLDILDLDSFVQVDLVYLRATVGSQRTTVAARTEHPSWNECFDFNVPLPNVKDVSLKLEVLRLIEDSTQTECLGQLRIGTQGIPSATSQWNEMLRECGKTVKAAHLLLQEETQAK